MALFDLLRGDSPDAFGKLIVNRLEKRGWPKRPRYDKARFVIELGGGWGDYRLEAVYQEWLQYPAGQRKAAIDQLVSGLFDPPAPETYEEAAPLLIPMIRNRAQLYNGAYRLEDEPPETFKPPPMRPLAHLAVLAALDRPGSIMLIDENLLQSWGKTFDEVLERAIANLRARDQRPFRRLANNLLGSDFQDYSDLSRLLMPELFTGFAFKGAPIAVAAARSRLIVADSKDDEALDKFAEFVEVTVEEDPRAVSYAPFILTENGWSAIEANATEQLDLRRLAIKQSTWDYSVQKELLEARGALPAGAAYIAPQGAWVYEEAGYTCCNWAEERAPLLPRCQLIGLRRRDGEMIGVRWSDIEEILGPPLEVEGRYPPLYRPPPWPSAAQWAALMKRDAALGWPPSRDGEAFR